MITWRPAALVACGALATAALRAPAAALPFLALAALLIAIDLMAAASPADLVLSRRGDTQTRLGDEAAVTLVVVNSGPRLAIADVRDAWPPSAGASPARHRIRLRPGESVDLTATLRPTRRGDRVAACVTIRCHGPLRHAYRQSRAARAAAATPPWTLRVLPRFDSRRLLAEKVAKLRIFDGAVAVRGRGQGSEFDSLREYVIGDDVRSIDWRATARHADVVVRTWRPERDRHVLCVIDAGRTSAVRLGGAGRDEPRLDAAIDAALLLGELASRAGDSVSLIAVDSQVRAAVTSGGRRSPLPKMINALAPLQPRLTETDFGLIVSEVLRRERKRALVVLFTALEAGALGEGLLPVLASLTARHKMLVAAVHDQAPPVRRAGVDADAVYLAAASHRALAERRRIATALTRHGVEIVDAPIHAHASAVADAYLRLKAAGKL